MKLVLLILTQKRKKLVSGNQVSKVRFNYSAVGQADVLSFGESIQLNPRFTDSATWDKRSPEVTRSPALRRPSLDSSPNAVIEIVVKRRKMFILNIKDLTCFRHNLLIYLRKIRSLIFRFWACFLAEKTAISLKRRYINLTGPRTDKNLEILNFI